MAFNRFIDRKFDALNPRTAIREFPSGIINPKCLILFIIINCLLFVTATILSIPFVLLLSPVALFVVLFYFATLNDLFHYVT